MAEENFRVGAFSAMDTIFPHHTVRRGDRVMPLRTAAPVCQINYSFNNSTYSIEDYLKRRRITGLLIIRDGTILYERYQHDRRETDRFASNSIAKSITSLAVGIALHEGLISSLDDVASRYVPELKGSGYGSVTIRQLLRMSSGIRFNEDYSGADDIPRFIQDLMKRGAVEALRPYNDRVNPPGSRFSYASPETLVIGLVLRAASKRNLAEYVSEKLWAPMGAEADATWIVAPGGMEWSFAKFNAVLRDYGRLGVLLANDGRIGQKQIIPADYLIEATDWHSHPQAFHPGRATPDLGYGYHFWLFPGKERRFALKGIFGQVIFIDPGSKTVIVQTAADRHAEDRDLWREFGAFAAAVVERAKSDH
jgi:CubicO group peptidase (beta-lactamase class C family)